MAVGSERRVTVERRWLVVVLELWSSDGGGGAGLEASRQRQRHVVFVRWLPGAMEVELAAPWPPVELPPVTLELVLQARSRPSLGPI